MTVKKKNQNAVESEKSAVENKTVTASKVVQKASARTKKTMQKTAVTTDAFTSCRVWPD